MSLTDRDGLPVTAASRAAVDAYDRGVRALLGFGAGARVLEAILRAEGLPGETAESAPGRANQLARLPGDGALPSVVLHHHIHVVYADRRYWSVDPFGGVVLDDDDMRRVHGNDERVSIDNIVTGVRAHPEMLLAVAGA